MADTPTPPESPAALARRLAFQPARPHLAIGLLFLVLGLLVTVALLRPQGDAPWRSARTEDLIQILDDLSTRQERLDTEAARLAALRADLERGSTSEALAESQRTLEALRVLAGTTPVSGPGITITIDDPEGSIDATVLLDAVQELRDAGAEAIQVGDSRIVVDSWFGNGPEGLVVSGEPVPRPIRIVAIGDAEGLAAAMRIPGGVADAVRTRGADFEATSAPDLTISVTVPETAD